MARRGGCGGPFLFETTLVLALIDRDGLVNEGGKGRGAADSGDSIFDFRLQLVIKQETFRAVVEI